MKSQFTLPFSFALALAVVVVVAVAVVAECPLYMSEKTTFSPHVARPRV